MLSIVGGGLVLHQHLYRDEVCVGFKPGAFIRAIYWRVTSCTVVARAIFGLVALFTCQYPVPHNDLGTKYTRCFLRRHSVQEVNVLWRGRSPVVELCIISVLRLKRDLS
jgi:hypothetical protein